MKHNFNITLMLIALFFVAQVFGVYTFYHEIPVVVDQETQEVTVGAIETTFGETTQLEKEEKGVDEAVAIIVGVLIATLLIFILIRFRLGFIFKYWFLFVVTWALIVAMGFYLPSWLAVAVGIILALWRVFKPNMIIHNITEVMIYTSIAIVLVGFLNIYAAFALLLAISVYDMIAVWKSKHMVKLAQFQTESKLFAGLSIPYSKGKVHVSFPKDTKLIKKKNKKITGATAVLGGGDIAFPLLFTIVTMQHLIENFGITKLSAMLHVFVITFFVTLSLGILFFKAEKGKFYPAMPFLSAGCFLGYGVMMLLLMF